jgi:aminopyrrolnitrin oxygenase
MRIADARAADLPVEATGFVLPRWPCGWYVVSRSTDLRPGSVRNVELGGAECVIFRTQSGALGALDAHCPHMGAHLRHGTVVGDRIRCALHGSLIGADGRVDARDSSCARAGTWQIAERFGLVFVHLGARASGHVPAPEGAEQYVWTTGEPVSLQTDWHNMVANSFDMPHLLSVHHRALVEPIRLEREAGRRVSLRYVSRVTGHSPSDRLMKWLSHDRIRVRMTCFGTVITAETDLGFTSTAAVMGLLPNAGGLRAFGAFGIKPGPFLSLRLLLTRLLFTAFLQRDFRVVEGMRLRTTNVRDPGLRALYEFLQRLPDFAP